MTQIVLPLVEGHSEVESVPVLLRRLFARLDRTDASVAKPFRVKRYQIVRAGELERAVVQGLRSRSGVTSVLVLLDADDDDPDALETALLQRCREVTFLPAAVVAATRELESWFLGSKDSLRGICGIRADARAPEGPEAIRGAKERLTRNMERRSYLEVQDQPTFAARMDLDLALERCASFRRLATALEHLLAAPHRAP